MPSIRKPSPSGGASNGVGTPPSRVNSAPSGTSRPKRASMSNSLPKKPSRNEASSNRSESTSVLSGWGAVKRMQEAAKEREEKKDFLLREFKLQDGEEALIQILSPEPKLLDYHLIVNKNGRYENTPCQKANSKDCLMCDDKINSSLKVVFKILDFRGERVKDEDTGEWGYTYDSENPVEAIWITSLTVGGQINSFIERKKRNATEMILSVTRNGKKTDTTYNLEIALDEDNNAYQPVDWAEEKMSLEEAITPKSNEELIRDGFAQPHFKN